MKTLLFIVNVDWFFLSHRLPIALAAMSKGYDVHVATGITDKYDILQAHGLIVHPLPIKRGQSSFIGEMSTFLAILKVINAIKPHILHLVTIKPVLYGGIVARWTRTPNVVAAISGLGSVFLAQGFLARVRLSLIKILYRIALKPKNLKVILQNSDDLAVLMKMKAIHTDQAILIRSSGVDLDQYVYTPEPIGRPIVTLASRLLKDKGIYEFIEAAKLLHTKGKNYHFWLVGSPDFDNITSITQTEIHLWQDESVVQCLGYRKDIPNLFAQSNLIVLPSYREGLPKVLVEAAACGRAVVTTDVPGCRDAIEPNKTGLLVPIKDPQALANAIEYLLENPNLRHRFGSAGRTLAEREFAIEHIVDTHLSIYQSFFTPS